MDIKKAMEGLSFTSDADYDITGITNDSRKVRPGYAFVSLDGRQHVDYAAYIADAKKNGAVAVVTQTPRNGSLPEITVEDAAIAYSVIAANLFGNPARKLKLIGVTGTNGKTSTAYLTKHLLEKAGKKTALIGTVETLIGSEKIPSSLTTPEPMELQSLFCRMADDKVEYCVMECSSQALAQKRLYGLRYIAAAFTNLTQDHMDYHGSMLAYCNAKCILFGQCDAAVLNADDDSYTKFAQAAEGTKAYRYSIKDKTADFFAENIIRTDAGIKYMMNGVYPVSLDIPGDFAIYNSMAAIGLAAASGMKLADACGYMSDAKPIKGRVEVAYKDEKITVIIDYAHTPDAISSVLKAIDARGGRKVVLFGCGGDRDSTKRPLMGSVAARYADKIIVTSDNPRSENPDSIIDDIMLGLRSTTVPTERITDRRAAIRHAIETAKQGDIIFLLGKGHEDYQILSTGKIHMDEREIIKEVIADLKKG